MWNKKDERSETMLYLENVNIAKNRNPPSLLGEPRPELLAMGLVGTGFSRSIGQSEGVIVVLKLGDVTCGLCCAGLYWCILLAHARGGETFEGWILHIRFCLPHEHGVAYSVLGSGLRPKPG